MDREYSPLPGAPLIPSLQSGLVVTRLYFPGIFLHLLLPSDKLVEIPLLPMEILSSFKGHRPAFSCGQGLSYMQRVLLYLSVKFFPIESSFPDYERFFF